ncbi:MAG: universal stress protein [Wenzhouxiangellaceae bacterium]|nr:universal stress protein [Wenzhouxiangellaceae bacterium]
MERLLVGIDDSECADRAVEVAARQARDGNAKLLVCYVIAWSPFTFSTPEENAQRHRRREEELEIARRKILEPRISELRGSGLQVEGFARHGHAARTLLQLAKEHEADMIVVGRAGDNPLKSKIFGGTAGALVQSSPIPVLVVP